MNIAFNSKAKSLRRPACKIRGMIERTIDDGIERHAVRYDVVLHDDPDTGIFIICLKCCIIESSKIQYLYDFPARSLHLPETSPALRLCGSVHGICWIPHL